MEKEKEHSLEVDLTYRAFMLPPVEDFPETFKDLPSTRIYAPIPSLVSHDDTSPEIESGMDPETIIQMNSLSNIRRFIIKHYDNKKDRLTESKNVSFKDIVDLDDEAFQDIVSNDLAPKLFESQSFKLFMTVLIILNSVIIALETNPEYVSAYGKLFKVLDAMFISAFTVEILIKWYYDFVEFWKSGWNIFDFLLIFSALVAPAVTFVSSGRIVRVLRILRAFRTLRNVEALEGLRLVAKTIIQSLPDMANIVTLLVLIMFIFAVVGVTLFRTAAPEWFGDLPKSMFSLFVLVTGDGFEDIFRELSDAGHFAAAGLYFVVFMIAGNFVLGNMIVAVVVTNLERSFELQKKTQKLKYRVLKSAREIVATNRPVLPLGEKQKSNFFRQMPLEVPDMEVLPQNKLENYFLVLSLIDDNMVEYKSFTKQLQEILVEIKAINMKKDLNVVDEAADESDEGEPEDLENEVGDPLSRLLQAKFKN